MPEEDYVTEAERIRAEHELANDLLRALEAHYGCAVQLQVQPLSLLDSQTKEKFSSKQSFGSFFSRPFIVRRVECLPQEYLSDIPLIEGEYDNKASLISKMSFLDALYNIPLPGSSAEEAHMLICKAEGLSTVGAEGLLRYDKSVLQNLGSLFRREGDTPTIRKQRLCDVLDEAKFTYLKHGYHLALDGFYDKETVELLDSTFTFSRARKVADISYKLIE
jgi:hypothetical protein